MVRHDNNAIKVHKRPEDFGFFPFLHHNIPEFVEVHLPILDVAKELLAMMRHDGEKVPAFRTVIPLLIPTLIASSTFDHKRILSKNRKRIFSYWAGNDVLRENHWAGFIAINPALFRNKSQSMGRNRQNRRIKIPRTDESIIHTVGGG